ncbi:MAG: hypothetical protein ACREHE_02815 [Rhizomicrobium sp.]
MELMSRIYLPNAMSQLACAQYSWISRLKKYYVEADMKSNLVLATILGIATAAATFAGTANKSLAAQNGGPGSYCAVDTDYSTLGGTAAECTCPPPSVKYYYQPSDEAVIEPGVLPAYGCYIPDTIIRWPTGGLSGITGKIHPLLVGDHNLVLRLPVQRGAVVNLSLSEAQAEEMIQVLQRGLVSAKARASRPGRPTKTEEPRTMVPKDK